MSSIQNMNQSHCGFRFLGVLRERIRPDRPLPALLQRRLERSSIPTPRSGKLYTMNERRTFHYLHMRRGVGPDDLLKYKNFHLPLELRPGAQAAGQTYNGCPSRRERRGHLPNYQKVGTAGSRDNALQELPLRSRSSDGSISHTRSNSFAYCLHRRPSPGILVAIPSFSFTTQTFQITH